MPIALIEAQLAGIPVIALDAGSVSEVIDSGKTGYVSKDFKQKYFQYLNQLLKDKKLRTKLGKTAKKRAKKEFDPGRLIQDHIKLIEKTI
jgi:glycosyltransferase involved in cell wall biosynthesis